MFVVYDKKCHTLMYLHVQISLKKHQDHVNTDLLLSILVAYTTSSCIRASAIVYLLHQCLIFLTKNGVNWDYVIHRLFYS